MKFKKTLGKTNGKIIGTFLEDMIQNSYDKGYAAVSHELGELLHELIDFNNKYIYHSDQAERYKGQAKKMLAYLFDDLLDELKGKERFHSYKYPIPAKDRSIPDVYRLLQLFVRDDMKDVYGPADPDELVVLDFVAGMTDSVAERSFVEIFIPKTTV